MSGASTSASPHAASIPRRCTVDLPPFPSFDVPLIGVDSIATNGYEGTSCAAGAGSAQPALRPTRVDASF